MITLEDGSEDMLPWVKVEIEPGRWPFEYWYEVHYLDNKDGIWTHYHQKDGGGFGLWRVWQKARVVLSDVWFELSK